MRERRKLADADDNNFNVLDTRQIADTMSGTTQIMTMLLGAVAAVSLVVGGIGIMNIMLVSVTERTREIGGVAWPSARSSARCCCSSSSRRWCWPRWAADRHRAGDGGLDRRWRG